MNTDKPAAAPFFLGNVVATQGALETFPHPVLTDALARHMSHDWQEMDPEDYVANILATHDGSRILSSYTYDGKRLWIITDAEDDDGHRHCTTFLLPEEY